MSNEKKTLRTLEREAADAYRDALSHLNHLENGHPLGLQDLNAIEAQEAVVQARKADLERAALARMEADHARTVAIFEAEKKLGPVGIAFHQQIADEWDALNDLRWKIENASA